MDQVEVHLNSTASFSKSEFIMSNLSLSLQWESRSSICITLNVKYTKSCTFTKASY